MKKPNAWYKLDDLFKDGDMIFDKETSIVFKYNIKKHRDRIFANPNNYRVAHSGDINIKIDESKRNQ
tara:strand:- start:832 stop:1032 length:201 start_codon:yes stop_codon:yes gene_type:complete